VAGIWAAAGVPVVSSDVLAREVVEPGTPGLEEVVEAFGEGVRAADGSLDRDEMRRRVFRDPDQRRRLEGLLHPRITELREEWMARQASAGVKLVVAEIPLLFEVGRKGEWDVTVLVDAPEVVRVHRIGQQRGLEEEEALAIMSAQMDPQEKRRRADYVLDNAGSLDELRSKAVELLTELRARAEEGK
jgi:dephospho-CoA kinase